MQVIKTQWEPAGVLCTVLYVIGFAEHVVFFLNLYSSRWTAAAVGDGVSVGLCIVYIEVYNGCA